MVVPQRRVLALAPDTGGSGRSGRPGRGGTAPTGRYRSDGSAGAYDRPATPPITGCGPARRAFPPAHLSAPAHGTRRPGATPRGRAGQPSVALLVGDWGCVTGGSGTPASATLRSPARSTPAPRTSPNASTVTRPNDTRSEVASASEPIADGAMRPEVYVMVATPAMARLGLVPLRP